MRMRRKSNHKQLMDSGFCLFNSKSQTATLMDENKDGPVHCVTSGFALKYNLYKLYFAREWIQISWGLNFKSFKQGL